MHRTPSNTPAHPLLSPRRSPQRPRLSPPPNHHPNKTQRTVNFADSRPCNQIKERQAKSQAWETGRSKGSSLRKHEHFGKIHETAPPTRPAETVPVHTTHGSHRFLQKREPSSGELRVCGGSSSGSCFQWGGAIQGEPNSQYYQSIKTGSQQRHRKQHPAPGLTKVDEVTFSMDSTEPESDEKSINKLNQYELPSKPERRQQEPPGRANAGSIGAGNSGSGEFLTAFRRKIIEKEIVEKEKVYRGYIRSSSREPSPHEKLRLKSKMKEVLDELYQLKKLAQG